MLSLRSHVTTSSTLLCLPSRFHKKLFSLKLLFSLGTIHLCQPHGRKAGGGWGLEICHVPVDSIVFTQHICCSILQMEGVFQKIDFLRTSHMYDALLSLTLAVLFSFHIFHQLWNLKFTGDQITKTLIGVV